ncbi:SpoIIAA family protein [Photobacterium leiognathi]|uniref:STAS/SEC14 domain-containing protein n=1 Tax=Photobacterium leiognathi TaxID=553611 RepID=UPI00298102C7|nr:STAS/SEC14 domain-containing protein [Photobacterium leiognathi]
MLTMLNVDIDNAVAFSIDGKVNEDDMKRILYDAQAKTEVHGKIVIFEQIDNFDGIEFSALLEEVRYVFHAGISHITKVAVVADKKWIEKIVKVEDKLFRNIDIQFFQPEEKDQAVEFLKQQ